MFERTFATSMIARFPAISVAFCLGPVSVCWIPFGQDRLLLSRVAVRRLAPQQEGDLKPQQSVIAHVDEKSVNQHNPCPQGPPDLVPKNQQDQGTENDKEHTRYQVDQKQGIAHAGYAKKVQEHKGPPQGEGFRLFSTVPFQRFVFGPGV
jgi:hypothetical protein